MRFAAAVFCALAATSASAQTVQAPAAGISSETPLVNITAEGRSERAPDLAVFNAGVVAQGKTAGEAMTANTARMQAVLAAVLHRPIGGGRGTGVARPREREGNSLLSGPTFRIRESEFAEARRLSHGQDGRIRRRR